MRRQEVVLITGASSGIGEAIAREYVAQGAKVALLARRADKLEALCKELGSNAVAIAADVTQDMTEAVQRATAALGDITVLVANAGGGVMGHFGKLTLEDYQSQIELNVYGVLRSIYACFDSLKRTKGSIVVVSSVMAYLPLPGASAYNVSKAAAKSLAESLRVDLSPQGINVTHIAPGFIATDLRRVDANGNKALDGVDPIPTWLQMPARLAARRIIRATRWRRGELVLTNIGKSTVFFARHFPWLTHTILALVSRRTVS